jgi:hypothetical protein
MYECKLSRFSRKSPLKENFMQRTVVQNFMKTFSCSNNSLKVMEGKLGTCNSVALVSEQLNAGISV